ncbi:MAG: MFS transporter, partial [Planctomycetota bacterium]
LYVPLVALQGFVSSLGQLIALRVGLGVVSAAISASAGGISAERSEPGNRARVMGINTFSFSLGVAVGPLLTGFIPSPALAFAIPSALAVLMFLLVLAMVPPDRIARRAAYGVVAQESPPRAPATQRSSAT